MFNIIDSMCANVLEIPTEEYIDKVEKLSEKRMRIVIIAILDICFELNTNASRIVKLKNIFNLIQ